MRGIFTLIVMVLALASTPSMGQGTVPRYRQFFFNPYLFNPAYVGINKRAEADIIYRQQWINFKDAPVTVGANIQLPTSSRVALGFSVVSDKQVLLRNTNFMATFGYIVPIAKNQSLRFGLSGGVGLNKLDLTADELNTNDPAIINARGNNFYVDGNFGVVYTNAGLRLGFALTDMFRSNAFSTEDFNKPKLSHLKNRLYSASYKFNLGVMGNVSMEPYVLYRQTEDGLQDSWEAASVFYFQDKFWTGGSYNQNNGLSLFVGMNIRETLRFSYSYEFPPFKSGIASNSSSHEIHLGINLGKKRSKSIVGQSTSPQANFALDKHEEDIQEIVKEEAEIPKPDSETATPPVAQTNQPRFVAGDIHHQKDMETPIDIEDETTRARETVAPQVKKELKGTTPAKTLINESFTLTQGHIYVVVGVFGVMDNSIKFSKEMISKGYMVNVGLNPNNNMYYVYIESTLDPEEAKSIRSEYKRKNLFKDAWVYIMK